MAPCAVLWFALCITACFPCGPPLWCAGSQAVAWPPQAARVPAPAAHSEEQAEVSTDLVRLVHWQGCGCLAGSTESHTSSQSSPGSSLGGTRFQSSSRSRWPSFVDFGAQIRQQEHAAPDGWRWSCGWGAAAAWRLCTAASCAWPRGVPASSLACSSGAASKEPSRGKRISRLCSD